MNASELKYQYQKHNPDGHFFDRDTMKAFGDTMRNFGVREFDDCWMLYRKRGVKGNKNRYFLFDKDTFKYLHGLTNIGHKLLNI